MLSYWKLFKETASWQIWCFYFILFNPITPGGFREQMHFWTFWTILAWIGTKIGLIYSKSWQHTFLITPASCLSLFCWAEIRISLFLNFLAFPFSPFPIILLHWLSYFRACFQFRNIWESILETGNFYPRVATCNRRKFCSKFFGQISEHFLVYLGLYRTDHSNLDIIGKISSSCSDDVRCVMGSAGTNGFTCAVARSLINCFKCCNYSIVIMV